VAKSMFDRMSANPKGDWTIADVATLAKQEGLELRVPRGGGSHHAVVSPHLRDPLTVPYKRPIKAPYIKNLVSYTEAHRQRVAEKEGDHE